MNKININKINDKNLKIIISSFLLIIVLCGVFIRINAGKNKEYFHMDEIYSQGLINYSSVQISDNKDLYNKVHTKDFFRDYIEISDKEKNDFKPIRERQLEDVHPPLYYFFLKIFTNFNLNNFSKWPGIILNIVIYVLSTFLIYLITLKLSKNKYLGFLPAILFTISPMAINHTIFIRMYEMSNFFTLLYSYVLLNILIENKDIKINKKNNNKDKKINIKSILKNTDKKERKKYILLGIVTIIGVLTHYYFALFVLGTYILSLIFFLKNNRKKDLYLMTLTYILSGIIYLIIWPLRLKNVANRVGGEKISLLKKIKEYIKIIDHGYIGISYLILILIVIFGINLLLEHRKIKKQEKRKIKIDNDKAVEYILLFASIIYFLIAVITSPFISARYIFPVISVISIILIILMFNNVNILLKNILKNKINIELLIIISLVLLIIYPQKYNLKKEMKKGLEYQYSDFKQVKEKIKNVYKIPLIYVYDNKDYYSITDDIYFLSKIDKSIIIQRSEKNNKKISTDEYILDINKALDKLDDKNEKKEILVLTNNWYPEEKVENKNIENLDEDIYPTQIKILKEIQKYKGYSKVEFVSKIRDTYLFKLTK